MAHIPGNTFRALGLGAALAVLSALACLAGAAARDARTLSLHAFSALTQSESVLMSCADAPTNTSTSAPGDLQWCADPSSPHCRPAVPTSHRLELWDNPDTFLLPALQVPVATYRWLPWPEPEAAALLSRSASFRLERPPRA